MIRTLPLGGPRPFSFALSHLSRFVGGHPMSRRSSQKKTPRTKITRKKSFDSTLAIHTPGQQQFAQIILRILRRIVR
jgi:prephenate dehydrogenase